MYRGIESHPIGERELLLAPGKRISGDPRVEREVMTPTFTKMDMQTKGTLIPIGGAATNDNLRVVVEHIPPDQSLTIITTTTAIPKDQFDNYSDRFRAVGLSQSPFHLGEHTLPEEGDAMLRLSGGTFATGGDQIRGRDVLVASGHARSLHEFYTSGKVVAGTSAGAHMMGELTSYGDEIRQGIGLSDLATFDTHSDKRDREERQRQLVEGFDVINFALSEGGGVIYKGDGTVKAFGKDTPMRWRYNGVQEQQLLHRGEEVELHSLRRKYPFKQLVI